jgi:hypothetical protein
MNRYILIFALVAVLSCPVGFCQSPSPTASMGPVCELSSRDVEVYGFYGTKEIVAKRVANLPVNLSDRRLFLQITQSGRTDGEKIQVKLFEKQKNGSDFTVTEWKKGKAPGLFDAIDKAIIQNKGKQCVGEAIKAVLTKKLGPGRTLSPLGASTSPEAAFKPSVHDTSGDFIKSVVILGC